MLFTEKTNEELKSKTEELSEKLGIEVSDIDEVEIRRIVNSVDQELGHFSEHHTEGDPQEEDID